MIIPVEFFFGFIAMSFSFVVIGLAVKRPELILISGVFFLVVILLTDTVTLGDLVSNSTYTGNNTSYQYEPNNYEFTEWSKVLFAMLSAVFMFIGGAIMHQNREGDYPFD